MSEKNGQTPAALARREVKVRIGDKWFVIRAANALQGLSAAMRVVALAGRYKGVLEQILVSIIDLNAGRTEGDASPEPKSIADARGRSVVLAILGALEPVTADAPEEIIRFVSVCSGIDYDTLATESAPDEFVEVFAAVVETTNLPAIGRAIARMLGAKHADIGAD